MSRTPSLVSLRHQTDQFVLDVISDDPDLAQLIQWLKDGFSVGVYQNEALDSSSMGRIAGLKVGKGCTFAEAPSRFPDGTSLGPGWKYVYITTLDPKKVKLP